MARTKGVFLCPMLREVKVLDMNISVHAAWFTANSSILVDICLDFNSVIQCNPVSYPAYEKPNEGY